MKSKASLILAVSLLLLSILACSTGSKATPTQAPPPPATQAPTTPPAQGQLVIKSTYTFTDQAGYYYVVGEIANQTSTALTSIELTIELKDAAGNSLLKDENDNTVPSLVFYPMLSALEPGASSPFRYSFDTSNGTPASSNVTITGQETDENITPASIKVEHDQMVDDGEGTFYLSGELVNTSDQWAHVYDLAGAGLDNSGKILTADWTGDYTTELAPAGDSAGRDRSPFIISFPKPGDGVAKWATYIEAETADAPTDYSLGLDITNTYIDDLGDHHIVGYVSNKGSQDVDSLVVGGVYAKDGTVLDADYSFTPISIKAGGKVAVDVSTFLNINYSSDQSAKVDHYTLQIDPYHTDPPSYTYVDMTASGESVTKDGATWELKGNVKNNSGKALANETVVVEVRDAKGNLVATNASSLYPGENKDSIAAGETSDYDINIYLDPSADTTGYTTVTIVVGEVSQ